MQLTQEIPKEAAKPKKTRFKRTKKFYTEHKALFWAIAAIFAILIFFFGTKFWLFLNLMLGNDTIITLTTPTQDFELKNGQTHNITFTSEVRTNPFCKAICEATYEDLSKNLIIKKEEFVLSAQKPIKLSYELSADLKGSGQKLYRETLVCKSRETAFCRTIGDNTSRSILITLNYDLNDDEIKAKEDAENILNASGMILGRIYGIDKAINLSAHDYNNYSEIKDILEKQKSINLLAESAQSSILGLKTSWDEGDYIKVSEIIQSYKDNLSNSLFLSEDNYNSLARNITLENNISIQYQTMYLEITKQISTSFESEDIIKEIEDKTADFKVYKDAFEHETSISAKKDELGRLKAISDELIRTIESETESELSSKKNESISAYEALCQLGYECLNITFIESITSIERACSEIASVNNLFAAINKTFSEMNLSEINQSQKELYNYVQNQIPACNLKKPDTAIGSIGEFKKANVSEIFESPVDIFFGGPERKCCIGQNCVACCQNNCENENYPVLFVHGHSFNKRLEAEYSLDAFNKLQDLLSGDGYINAGAISLYTISDNERDVWEEIPSPLSIKVSYYYDIFKSQEDYVLVQTKSENIDTYALRLNDLVNSIIAKTGKKKVTIIAHSMGGLVARRYIQIFGGEKIDKFIMVATPNNGVTGAIADYCAIIGGEKECEDMKKDSLFLNKLNREKMPDNVRSYVIYGKGCNTNGEDGDGIVTTESAKLSYTENIEIKGNCTTFDTLHLSILDTSRHPELYTAIKEILKENSTS